MTIHKQYFEYHALKDSMYAQIKAINMLGMVTMAIGLTYAIYLTLSLFLESIEEPLAVIISEAVVFGSDIGTKLKEEIDSWTVIIYKITGFMIATICIVLASFIFYYKGVIKVNALFSLRFVAKICLWSYIAVGLIHCSFVAYFTITEKIVTVHGQSSYQNLDVKNAASTAIAIVLQLIFFACEFTCFFIFYFKIKTAVTTMIKFHDYLIEYRLTPRSRILRKHLPKMSMVMEEESNMDQSSMMDSRMDSRMLSSNSRLMSAVSHRTITS